MIADFYPRNIFARLFALAVTLIPLSVFASMAAADVAAMKQFWPRPSICRRSCPAASRATRYRRSTRRPSAP
jgi:hypothetical protein